MRDYATNLKLIPLARERAREPTSPCTPAEQHELRAAVGALSWLATKGRPDLAFEVARLHGQTHAACVADLLESNRVVKRAQKDAGALLRFMPFKPACIIAISDSSFANMQGGRSQCGHFLLLGDEALARGDFLSDPVALGLSQ